MTFTMEHLRAAGFAGWVPLRTVRTAADCPSRPGIYVVVYPAEHGPRFLPASCGGRFKGRDPAVAGAVLAANWVEQAEVVYIGKANDLRRRLRQFADFGNGKAVGHWGGRLLWQLDRPDDLRVGWRETRDENPLTVEARMIADFTHAYGKPPFANRPDRLGS